MCATKTCVSAITVPVPTQDGSKRFAFGTAMVIIAEAALLAGM